MVRAVFYSSLRIRILFFKHLGSIIRIDSHRHRPNYDNFDTIITKIEHFKLTLINSVKS
jgi:hypothetical protein